MREILQGISNIQHILANSIQRHHMDKLTKEIGGTNGIQNILEEVSKQTNDTIYFVTELKASQEKIEKSAC